MKNNSEPTEEYYERIKKIEDFIRKLYMNCQTTIFTMYFNSLYDRLKTIENIKYYRKRLEDYKELLGFYTDENQEYYLEYYKKYYDDKEQQLILLEADIKRRNDLALTIVNNNLISQMFNKLKKAIKKK